MESLDQNDLSDKYKEYVAIRIENFSQGIELTEEAIEIINGNKALDQSMQEMTDALQNLQQ